MNEYFTKIFYRAADEISEWLGSCEKKGYGTRVVGYASFGDGGLCVTVKRWKLVGYVFDCVMENNSGFSKRKTIDEIPEDPSINLGEQA